MPVRTDHHAGGEVRYCAETWLVATARELPADPGVAYSGKPPIVGCNQVVCDDCGVVVRRLDDRTTTSNMRPVAADLRQLYESAPPGGSAHLRSETGSRVYLCRCNWYGVVFGGAKWVDDLDQTWRCGGHPPAAVAAAGTHTLRANAAGTPAPHAEAVITPAPHADAVVAPALLVDAVVTHAARAEADRQAAPAAPAKIAFRYAIGVNPEFSTASELRDCLLASYPDAAYFGGPVVGRNRDDTAPAWGWVVDLIRTRSDWWPALGIALQHACADGGDLARTAFATLVANFRDSLVLLPWTRPVAAAWPDVRAPGTGTGWGVPDFRIETIIRDQERSLAVITAGNAEADLREYGGGGLPVTGPFTNEDDLRALLTRSARAGRFSGGTDGPWSWLGFHLLTGDPWLRPAFVRVASTLEASDERNVYALLDWFWEERDLWQFVDLLEAWVAHNPPWWPTPAKTRPKAWRNAIRTARWPDVTTLGGVASEALRRARHQVATPPITDLPPRYGPTT